MSDGKRRVRLVQIAVAATEDDGGGESVHYVALDDVGRPWRYVGNKWMKMSCPEEPIEKPTA